MIYREVTLQQRNNIDETLLIRDVARDTWYIYSHLRKSIPKIKSGKIYVINLSKKIF